MCAVAVLALAGGCLTGSVKNQRLAHYRPNAKPYRPVAAKVARPAPVRPAPVPGQRTPLTPAVPKTPPRPKAEPAPAPSPAPRDRDVNLLKVGDHVSISIISVDNIQTKDVVDEDGNVNLPLIGQVKIGGLKTSQAEKMIEKSYIDGGFFARLTVIVVAEKEDYFIHGQVMKAGRFPWTSDLTLMKAIGAAGGFTPYAKETKIELRRGALRITCNAERISEGRDPDPPIKPGDQIVVNRRIVWK